jgi:F-box and leucine-rich repeat protein 7
VRITGTGVEAVVEGCTMLKVFDVSQWKNLARWLEQGGEERSRRRWRRDGGKELKFVTEKVTGMGGLR